MGGMNSGPSSRASTRQSTRMDGEEVTRGSESRLLSYAARKRFSELSMTDVADRHLRDRTDAIAYIIRNISEQCAAAVEGLDLARRADTVSTEGDDENRSESGKKRGKRPARNLSAESLDGESQDPQTYGSERSESEYDDGRSESTGYLHPKRSSHVPPTPDLVHDRSSTSMSLGSESTAATPQRQSIQSQYKTIHEDVPEMSTRIADNDDSVGDIESDEPITKFRPVGSNNDLRVQAQ